MDVKDEHILKSLAEARQNAKMHSDILDFTCDNFIVNTRSGINIENIPDNIQMILHEYASTCSEDEQRAINSVAQQVDYLLSTVNDLRDITRSSDSNADFIPDYLTSLFSYLSQINCESSTEFCSEIQNIVLRVNEEYELDEFSINCVSNVASIYEDSYLYWIDNYHKWLGVDNMTRAHDWEEIWESIKETATVLGEADAKGAAAVYLVAGAAALASGGALTIPAGTAIASGAASSSIVEGVDKVVEMLKNDESEDDANGTGNTSTNK